MPKKRKLSLLDKIYIPIILMLCGWAGSQFLSNSMTVERLDEKIKHLEETTHENRDSVQALIDLHLQR